MSEIAAAAAVGPPRGMQVRLSSNESAWGPSPRVIEAVRAAAEEVHLYPDDQSVALRTALAKHEGVDVDEVVVGNGSADLLMDLIAVEHRRTGGGVVACDRGFIVYRLGAQVCGATYTEAPSGDAFARDAQALLDTVGDDTAVVCIDNPGNPTGRHLNGEELAVVIDGVPEHVTIVVDEAYHHFAEGRAGYRTVADLDVDHPRLLVLRTFSKAFALAGLRIGYLTGPADLLASFDTARTRFNVNAVAQAAVSAALEDTAHLAAAIEGTMTGRERLLNGLRELGVDVAPSLGNFVLVPLGRPAGPVVEAYAERSIGVRPLAPYRLDEHVRVTVGTRDEVEAFLEASADILA